MANIIQRIIYSSSIVILLFIPYLEYKGYINNFNIALPIIIFVGFYLFVFIGYKIIELIEKKS